MKRLIICLLLLSVLPTPSRSQQRPVRALEAELGGGITFGASALHAAGFDKAKTGATGFFELRYNMRRLPLDVGFRIGGTVFGREICRTGEKLNFSSGNFMAVVDYTYRRSSGCMLFAGAGMGLATLGNSASIECLGDGGYVDNGSDRSFCFMPRVGVEFWHRLRLTCSYMVEDKANRHFDLTVGIAIGGGRK